MLSPAWPDPSNGPAGVACVGETMVSLVSAHGQLLDDATELQLDIAGAESNVAMYLADQGIPASWVSRVGDDPFGRRILTRIAATGADVSDVEVDTGRPTGLMVKDPQVESTRVYYYRGGSAASAMSPGTLNRPAVREASILHLTGITAALSTSCAELARAALRPDRVPSPSVSFDVNYRPTLWAPDDAGPVLYELASRADVTFVGLDEANRLWGPLPDAAAVRELLSGPPLLIVKDGPVGATAFTAESELFVPALRVDVAEPVGAGDAFAAGVLAGLARGQTISTALRRGHLTAVAALRVRHDHGPLLPDDVFDRLIHADAASWEAAALC